MRSVASEFGMFPSMFEVMCAILSVQSFTGVLVRLGDISGKRKGFPLVSDIFMRSQGNPASFARGFLEQLPYPLLQQYSY